MHMCIYIHILRCALLFIYIYRHGHMLFQLQYMHACVYRPCTFSPLALINARRATTTPVAKIL